MTDSVDRRDVLLGQLEWLCQAADAAGQVVLDPGEHVRFCELVDEIRALDGDTEPITDDEQRTRLLAEATTILLTAITAGRRVLDATEDTRYRELLTELRGIDG